MSSSLILFTEHLFAEGNQTKHFPPKIKSYQQGALNENGPPSSSEIEVRPVGNSLTHHITLQRVSASGPPVWLTDRVFSLMFLFFSIFLILKVSKEAFPVHVILPSTTNT